MKRKGQVKELIPALVVPMMLLISVSVFTRFQAGADYQWETVYNESVTFTDNASWMELSHPPLDEGGTVIVANYTDVFPASASSTNSVEANYSYTSEAILLRNNATYVQGTYNVSYTGHGGDGWDSYDDIKDGTMSGYSLASLVPYVIVAVLVLGALIGIVVFK